MATVQQSAEALIQERRAILKDLLVMINNYDKARHDEVKDKLAEKFIRYYSIIKGQNKTDSIAFADLFLSDLALEMELCLKICSDDNDRHKKLRDIDSSYYENRKFSDPLAPVEPKDFKARDEQSILEQSITEFYQAVPSIAIRQQNKKMAEKVPEEIKALVKKVLKELENCPKKSQAPYEEDFNRILRDILNNISEANKQNEYKAKLTELSKNIVHDLHNENIIMLEQIKGKNLGSVCDSLEQLSLKLNVPLPEQQGEYEIQFKSLLTKTLNNVEDCTQKEKEYEKAVANEKARHVLRTVAIVGAGVVATVGLAALSFFTFGAALPHAIFLGGLGLTAMIKTLEYNDNKKDKNLWQLRSDKNKFIREATESVTKESEDLLRALNTPTPNAEPLPQPRESNIDINRSGLFGRPKSMCGQIVTPNYSGPGLQRQ